MSIIRDDARDFGTDFHTTPARGDAIFTWDYSRTRAGLGKLYEKAKSSQWNGSTDLDWSIDVDIEQVAREMSGAVNFFQQRMTDVEGSPVKNWGDKEWLQFQMEAFNWRMSQFLHGEQGALLCTGKIVVTTPWIDAKYYAASQVMDEHDTSRCSLGTWTPSSTVTTRSTPTCNSSSTTCSATHVGT